MTLTHILVFTVFALLAGWLLPARGRTWALIAGSLAAVYWLQPSSPIRNLDFWLPTAAIFLTVFVWTITRAPNKQGRNPALRGALVVIGMILLIGLTRYLEPLCCLTPTRPPNMVSILTALVGGSLIALIPVLVTRQRKVLAVVIILLILLLFLVIKTEFLLQSASAGLRLRTGQSAELASALDIPWLGFSYLAFRLLHVLLDYQSGRARPDTTLGEFITYALFFPTYTAGPIDRSERFIKDLRQPASIPNGHPNPPVARRIPYPNYENIWQGGQRILLGAFKKFVIADSLALISLNAQNASQVTSSVWMWVLLYAYTLQIYLDFSGYTDIAIGLGRLMSFYLPENFERPYLKLNLTTFWNSWHITLAQWFRAYLSNPLTRSLRMRPNKLPTWVIILIGQLSTMLSIGLWHGVTWNFAIWGLWHAFGLFIHNRWSTWVRPHQKALDTRLRLKIAAQITSWLLTFQYVALGWVWFALPQPALSWQVLRTLFGQAL